jgi:selenocysteine lyase/cysteine desulfurase
MNPLDSIIVGLRKRLPLLEKSVSLNHAGIAPQPRSAMIEAFEARRADGFVAEALQSLSGLPSRIRAAYARMTKVTPEEIAITRNTAEGVNIIAQGFPWKKGDSILTVDIEYPSNVYPWWNLRERGVTIKAVPERNGRVDLDEFLSAIDSSTRLVAISHVEFASGFRFDLALLSAACRERDIFLFVDVAQSLGALPVDLSLVDAAAWPTWKWLMGPIGMGGFYLARHRLDLIKPVYVGSDGMVPTSDYLDYNFTPKPDASRFEFSTGNPIGEIGAEEALKIMAPIFSSELAVEATGRIFSRADRLIEILASRGARLYSSLHEGERSGILSFTTPDDPHKTAAQLKAGGVEVTVRAGRLRLAPHFYNDEEDVERVKKTLSSN